VETGTAVSVGQFATRICVITDVLIQRARSTRDESARPIRPQEHGHKGRAATKGRFWNYRSLLTETAPVLHVETGNMTRDTQQGAVSIRTTQPYDKAKPRLCGRPWVNKESSGRRPVPPVASPHKQRRGARCQASIRQQFEVGVQEVAIQSS
jgi:hypothetical protein